MGDSETEYIVELQPKVTQRLTELGFNDAEHCNRLAHGLAEIASRARTLDQQALPLFVARSAASARAGGGHGCAEEPSRRDAGLDQRCAGVADGINRFPSA